MDLNILKSKIQEGDRLLMEILYDMWNAHSHRGMIDSNLPNGIRVYVEDESKAVRIGVLKTPKDRESRLLLVYQSNIGWIQEGPWQDIFIKWAKKAIDKHDAEAVKYAKHWEVELS